MQHVVSTIINSRPMLIYLHPYPLHFCPKFLEANSRHHIIKPTNIQYICPKDKDFFCDSFFHTSLFIVQDVLVGRDSFLKII